MLYTRHGVIAIGALVALPLTSLDTGTAAAETAGEGPADDPAETLTGEIVGGEAASTCQWPTTVALYANGGLCTGTLVHPEIVLYAAHCGSSFREVLFGEDLQSGIPRAVDTDHCRVNTTAMQVGPDDFAYCKLAEPVTDTPITPVLMGCEGDQLTPGRQVAIAGFGADEQNQAGVKNWAMTTYNGPGFGGMLSIGGAGTSAWQGDSGGPAFAQLDDGGWRAIGIVSGGSQPGSEVLYVDMRTVVAWVEQNSGVDMTPCHTAEGAWDPTEECGFFATAPTGAGNSWTAGCSDTDPLTFYSETCGDPFVADETPPLVSIVTPEDGELFEIAPSEVVIRVDAVDDGRGVERVWLDIPGVDGWEDTEAPYEFHAEFPEGEYPIVAHAVDRGGNEGTSDEVVMFVGVDGGGCCATGGGSGGPGTVLLILGTALLVGRATRWRYRR